MATDLFWGFIVLFISSMPLYFALRLIKGKIKEARFIRVMLVNFLASAVISAVSSSLGVWGGAISFIAVLFVYKEMFDLDWLTAFLVWLLQVVLVFIIAAVFVLLLGISLFL